MLTILTSFLILTFLEIVLGIDNLVFISILTQRLPPENRAKAWKFGLMAAWVTRLMLLASVVLLTKLQSPLFTVFDISFSIRDLILLAGGLFLLYKASMEIREELNPRPESAKHFKPHSFLVTVLQIAVIDIVFSLDSVITAVALTDQFWIMAAAITVAIIVMLAVSSTISHFIEKNPAIRILAYCFLLLIGTVLVADGIHIHVPRGYVYFAIGFSLFVEIINHRAQSRPKLAHKAQH